MWARVAPALLAHLNLLLTVYGGAALAMAARLKWDPSTYVVVRELFPEEYRAASAALALGGAALLLLPHVSAAALHASGARARSLLLYVYAALLALLMAGEMALGAWLATKVAAFQHSVAAQQLAYVAELGEQLRALLHTLERWHPLPHRIDELMQEAQEDAPRNVYAVLALAALLAPVQLLALVAALVAARRSPARCRSDSELPLQPRPPSYTSGSSYDYQRMPRTAYRNGRIVILGPPRA